ncbi:beta-galactosidase [Opitutaceae bacterium TAV5]|nr:beta-galactosidase [Opitutaceae bacterium TAV5]
MLQRKRAFGRKSPRHIFIFLIMHTLRPVSSLNGLREFAFLGAIDPGSFSPSSAPAIAFEKAPVPSAFDALPAHAGKRGAAVYRMRFSVPAGRRARLEFGAVSMWCRVWIDGTLAAEHACGYAPFTVEVPARRDATERELVVLADNRYDFERVPMHEEYFDFYQYGGILREVALHVLPEGDGAFIDHLQTIVGAGYAEGRFRLNVHLAGGKTGSVALVTQIDGEPANTHKAVPVKDAVATLDLVVKAPRVWSPESPQLHTVRVTLVNDNAGSASCDTTEIRFGLRHIEARAGKLWLNGQPIKLRGYNRHEWHPNFGPCTPALQMIADIQLMKGLGCNFVRGSHYPQDQRFLDLCDEFGLLVWEENLGWGQREKTFASAKWRADHARALRAMVRASCNHPSVIIWGFLNEAGTDADYVRPVFEETAATLRALDPSRLVSYASMFGKADKHFDLADLISLNIYPGWYGCEGVEKPLDLIAPAMREFFASIDARGFADKPVMISEIGAEGLYGWRDAHDDFFTEEYQADYIRRACEEALGNPRSSGIALWHFSDVRTYGGGWSLKRPRAFNNKGTFDEYRRPKAAARVVRDVFGKSA